MPIACKCEINSNALLVIFCFCFSYEQTSKQVSEWANEYSYKRSDKLSEKQRVERNRPNKNINTPSNGEWIGWFVCYLVHEHR